MKLQMYILASFGFVLSLYLFLNFVSIWQSGNVSISEPNPLVLLAETFIVLAALIFSFYCMAKQLLNIIAPRK